MGLTVHPNSTCDICLCDFLTDIPGKMPHAIACGHIFCQDCLYAMTPPSCPKCRKPYQPNKMKKLHVDAPDELDDQKDLDLLQQLVLSWDTPQEQLQQVVAEVDTWLDKRSDTACIALRKARTNLERNRMLKNSEAELRNAIAYYEEEKQRLEQENHQAREQAAMQIQIHEETHRTQLRQLTEELAKWKLKYRNSRPGYGSYGATRNPLPAPPEPISTEQVPTFEQAMSQSVASSRYIELPAESSRYRTEGESRSRRSRASEDRYSYASHYASHTPSSSSSSHYVQPHVSSPPSHMSSADPHQALQIQLHPRRPLDVFGLTSDLIHEYGVGYAQGHRSALRNRWDEPVIPPPDLYVEPISSRTSMHPSSAYITETDPQVESTHSFYVPQPHSAPPSSSARRQRRRQGTLQSSIVASSPSNDYVEPRSHSRSRSRSRSRSSTPSASSSSSHAEQAEVTNPLVVSILPEAASTPRSNPARSITGRPSSPQHSVMSRLTTNTVDSWGTNMTGLSEGSLGLGLQMFRIQERPADAVSSRTRQSSISDLSSLGLDDGAALDASPVRPVTGMAGVLPDVNDDPDLSSSSAETLRQSARTDRGGHRSSTSLNQHAYYEDTYRSQHSSTARLPDHSRRYDYSQDERSSTSASYRSPAAVDPRSYRSDYAEAPAPSLPHRDSEHSSYGRLRRSGQPLRASDTLPVESPGFPVSVEYTQEEDGYYFDRRPESRSYATGEASGSFSAGNALGLDLSRSGELPAPTPIVPTNSMMRSWNEHNRN